jgi:hypothetical protein
VLPWSDPTSFRILAGIGSLALVALLYAYIRRVEGVGSWAAFVSSLFLALNPYLFGFNVFNYFQLGDLFALIALIGVFWALRAGRWVVLAILMAVGALCRESVLLAVPAVAVWVVQHGKAQTDGPKAAMAVLPAFVVFVMLRFALEGGGPGLLEAFLDEGRKAAVPATWFRILVGAFAPMSLLPLVFWSTTRTFLKERQYLAVYFVAVVASCFFGHDQERLMQPALIVFYPLLAVILHEHLSERASAIGLLLVCAWAASLHHISARYPLPSQDARIAIVLIALIVATAVAAVVRLRDRALPRLAARESGQAERSR